MIYTSYFAKASTIKDAYRVSISLFIPKGIYVNEQAIILAPTWDILNQYKRNYDTSVYTKAYLKLLQDRHEEVSKLINHLEEISKDKLVLLLCWEGPNKFCHRHILADYLKKGWKEL